ncbi:MAG: hypothetical protein VW892_05825 [Flavobacteriaceae bacterium]
MKNLTPTSLFRTIFFFGIATLLLSCGTYQGSYYYGNDGIYEARTVYREYATTPATNSGANRYYKNYFQNLSDDYGIPSEQGTVFTDVDAYTSVDSTARNQQPWGAQTQKTEIYVIDNTRNFAPNFGFDWYYNTWGYPYWGYYQPFGWWNRPYRFSNPYWGWSYYSPFYNSYYNGFYGPYWGWSYGWNNFGYGYGFAYGSNNHGIRINTRRAVSRVASRRGEKGYGSTTNNTRTAINRGASREVTGVRNTNSTTGTRVSYNAGRYLNAASIDNVPTTVRRSSSSQTGSRALPSRSVVRVRSTASPRANAQSSGRNNQRNSTVSRPSTRTRSTPARSSSYSSGRSSSSSAGRSSSSGRRNN